MQTNPSATEAVFAAPSSPNYVGFWARVGASLLDTLFLMLLMAPLLWWLYGYEYFTTLHGLMGPADAAINYLMAPIIVVCFWVYRSATPGKMTFNAIIVDVNTLQPPKRWQLIARYLSYYLSLLGFGWGFFSIAWHPKKQGWHDLIANTVVIRANLTHAHSNSPNN